MRLRHPRPLLALSALTVALVACKPTATTPPPEVTTTTEPHADILANSDLPAPLATPLADDTLGVTIHRLKNGLTVYISTDRQKPRFSAWVAVRAGSRHDPKDSTGLAHYLEHMLFKGTDELGTLDFAAEKPHLDRVQQLYKELRDTTDPARRQELFAALDQENQAIAKYAVPNEFDRLYSNLGINGVNAFTSDDMTVYIADVPANRLEAWAKVETERLKDPSFRLFFTEIESVYEEKNLSLDSPDSRAYEALLRQLFPTHPYGTQTTIGSIEHLKTPAYQDMVEFFQRWYVPNNMALLLAGDIDPATALPVLERTLGTWTPKALAPVPPATLTPITARAASEVVGEGEQSVSMAWATVPFTHADEPVLRVMDWLLDNGTSGLLNVELELTQKVPDASAYTYSMHEAGMFGLRATARDGQKLEDVEALLLGVLDKLKAGEFTQADIDAIVLANEINRKRSEESPMGRVSRMMEAYINRQPWPEQVAREAALRKVTREDVMRAAKAYIGPGYSVVYRRAGKPELAKIEKPKISAIEVDPSRKSPFASAIEAIKAPELNPEWLVEGTHYTRLKLPGGQLLAAQNPRNDLFSVRYQFHRGHRGERMLCHALEVLEQSGAGDTPPDQFQKQLFALGTSISFSCNADTTSIFLSGIDANLQASVELLKSWLAQPRIDPALLQSIGDNVLSTRKDEMEDPDSLWGVLGDYAQFDRNSDNLALPTNQQIRSAKAEPLRKLLQDLPNYEHKTSYFGPRPAAEVASILAIGSAHKPLRRRPPLKYRSVKKPTVFFVHREVAKSYVSVALPHGVGKREDRPVARLFNSYLGGGMNGLLFQEMREARGLVYFAYGSVSQGRYPDDTWAMVGGMGTQVDKTPDAVTTFLDLIRSKALNPSRISSTRTTIDQEYRSTRVDPRATVSVVDFWDDSGETSDPRPWMWEQIQKLSDDELRNFAGTLADKPVIIAVIGDRNRIDMAALKAIGDVVEVQPDKLFSFGAFPKAATPAK